MPTDDAPEWFLRAVRRGESITKQTGVVVVANVKGRTHPIDDYEGHSIITDFLSATELDTLMGYFESAKIYSEVVLDEQGFFEWLTNRRNNFPRRHILVLNLAQNGTGPARFSLVAGICRIYGLPLLDCGDAYTVAITQHKFHSLSLLTHFNLPVAHCWSFTSRGWFPAPPPEGSNLVAKLTYDSASIGMSDKSVFQMDSSQEARLLELIAEYRQPLTIQEFVAGYEVEVPVFETDSEAGTIAAVGIQLDGHKNLAERVLTYETVFHDNYDFYDFSTENGPSAQRAMSIARRTFRALDLSGIARVDFRIRSDGSPLIMEVNSKPQITEHSGFMYALKTIGRTGSDLMNFLVGRAALRYGLPN
jgi:D-alanine-D-alanine ligase